MALWVTALLGLSVVATLLEEYSWIFSLVTHFREWFLVLSISLILLIPWITKNRIFILSLIVFSLCFHSWAVLPYWKPVFQRNVDHIEKTETLNIFFANLNSQNQEKHRLIDYLRRERPDFVFLVEVNKSWMREIKKLESRYPYSKEIVRESNFGIAVLSQTPLEGETIFVDRLNMIPALFLKTKSSIGEVNLVVLHAYPPIGKEGTITRDQYLETLSRRMGELSLPLLVCGDLNTTPWTHIFQKFLQNSGLELSKNSSPPNTWPVTSFIPGLPIDHCFSKGLRIVKYGKGIDIGSDHWPLIMQVSSGEKNELRKQ